MSIFSNREQKPQVLDDHLKDKLTLALRASLGAVRFQHSRRVAQTATLLARRLGLPEDDAWIAGFFHDYAREWPDHQLVHFVQHHDGAIDAEEKEKPLFLHGRVAAIVLEKDFQISQPGILEAMEHHTLGKSGMGPLAKLLFVADYVEPLRKYTTVAYRRSIRSLCLDCMVCSVIDHCNKRNKDLHPRTAAFLSESQASCTCGVNRGELHG